MDLQGKRIGPIVGHGLGDFYLSGDGSEGGSGSQSWSKVAEGVMGDKGKVKINNGGLLQIEGPTQDTASSLVKTGEPRFKSKGVIIAAKLQRNKSCYN